MNNKSKIVVVVNRDNGFGYFGRGFSYGWGCGGYTHRGIATTAVVHYHAKGGFNINCNGHGYGEGGGIGYGMLTIIEAMRRNFIEATPDGVFIIPIEIKLEQMHK